MWWEVSEATCEPVVDWRDQNHWIRKMLAGFQAAEFFSIKNKMGPTATRWASAFWLGSGGGA